MKIGIDLGGTKTEGILIDDTGKELARNRIKTEKNYDKNYYKTLFILIIGSIIIFTPGILWLGFWYNILSGNAASLDISESFSKAITNGLLLYKFTEPVKIALAATITPLIWSYLKK